MSSSTTLYDIAQLLMFDYGPTLGTTPTLPTDNGTWDPVKLDNPPVSVLQAAAIGFEARIFKNSITHELVVTFRGTTNIQNYFEDAILATGSVLSGILNYVAQAAVAFGEEVAREHPTETITFAGHSLGGYAAEAATVEVLNAGLLRDPNQLSTVTFNAPGLPPSWFLGKLPGSYHNAYNFNTQGDIVHLAGGIPGLTQLGQSTTVAVGPTAAQEWADFAQTFGPSEPDDINSAVDAGGVKLIHDWLFEAHPLSNFVGVNTGFNNQQAEQRVDSLVDFLLPVHVRDDFDRSTNCALVPPAGTTLRETR